MIKAQLSANRSNPFILIEVSYKTFSDLKGCTRIMNAKVQPNMYINENQAILITDPIITRIE